MAVESAVAFATFLLENDHVFTFNKGFCHFANHLSTFYSRSAYCNVALSVYEKHLGEFHRIAGLSFFAKIVDIQVFACFGLELLSLNFYNCVHLEYNVTS